MKMPGLEPGTFGWACSSALPLRSISADSTANFKLITGLSAYSRLTYVKENFEFVWEK